MSFDFWFAAALSPAVDFDYNLIISHVCVWAKNGKRCLPPSSSSLYSFSEIFCDNPTTRIRDSSCTYCHQKFVKFVSVVNFVGYVTWDVVELWHHSSLCSKIIIIMKIIIIIIIIIIILIWQQINVCTSWSLCGWCGCRSWYPSSTAVLNCGQNDDEDVIDKDDVDDHGDDDYNENSCPVADQ